MEAGAHTALRGVPLEWDLGQFPMRRNLPAQGLFRLSSLGDPRTSNLSESPQSNSAKSSPRRWAYIFLRGWLAARELKARRKIRFWMVHQGFVY